MSTRRDAGPPADVRPAFDASDASGAAVAAPPALAARLRAFADAVRADGREFPAAISAWHRCPGATDDAGLAVYRHAWRARMTEALRSNYPVLHRVLGVETFVDLAQLYLRAEPSRHPNLRWFGHRLAPWLQAHPEAVPHAALADLAAMEWALGCTFDAADAEPLTFEALQASPPPDFGALRFGPHPSVQRIELQWAVEPLWQQLTRDPEAETSPPEPLRHELLAWRQGLDTRWRSLPADEARLLGSAFDATPFGLLCQQAAADPGIGADAAPVHVATLLRQWLAEGLLVRQAAD